MIIERSVVYFYHIFFTKPKKDELIVKYLSHRLFKNKYGDEKYQAFFYKILDNYKLKKTKKDFDRLIEIFRREIDESIGNTNNEILEISKEMKALSDLLKKDR